MKPRSGFAVTSLVLGILVIIFSVLAVLSVNYTETDTLWGIWIPATIVIAFLTVIFGAIGIGQTGKNSNHRGRGFAIAGLCLGIIEIGLFILIFFIITRPVY